MNIIIYVHKIDNGSLTGETRSASTIVEITRSTWFGPFGPIPKLQFKYTIVKIYLRYLSQCNHDGISEKRTRNPLNNIINTNTREVRILASAKILVLNKKHCLYW